MTDEISESSIPAWKKDNLRNDLKLLKKSLDDADRAAKAARVQRVIDHVGELSKASQEKTFIVERVEDGCHAKGLDAALKQVKTNSPHLAAMLFSVDKDAKKILCLCQVPKTLVDSKGLKADEWVKKISHVIGGKGGGKPISAQGSGDKIDDVNKAIDLAKEFATLTLSS